MDEVQGRSPVMGYCPEEIGTSFSFLHKSVLLQKMLPHYQRVQYIHSVKGVISYFR